MSLFKYNPFRTSEELIPAPLRQNKVIAFVRVLLRPVKYLSDLFLDDYCKGSNAPLYDNAKTYTKYQRVKWIDMGVYELRVASSVGVKPVSDALSKTNWLKVQENWIGCDERVYYNTQIIVFEYAMNRWFNITSAPYAYIENVGAGVMGSNYTTLYFPLAVYNSLGSTSGERFNNVKNFFDKYAPAGQSLLSVVTF